MKKDKQKIGMVGYRPNLLESMKINYIGEVFNLNNTTVLRELIYGHWTLDDMNAIAHKVDPEFSGSSLVYMLRAYNQNKSIDGIILGGKKLYRKEILGVDEPDEWEILQDKK